MAEGADKLYPWTVSVDVSGLAPGDYTFVATNDDPSGGEGVGPDSRLEDVRDRVGRCGALPTALNRTLLDRQHLLARTSSTLPDVVEHLVGLQAQDNLPPYLGLAARLERFDPYDVTRGLEDRSLVRLLTMRGTIHLLVADDALTLRRSTRPSTSGSARSARCPGRARRRPRATSPRR